MRGVEFGIPMERIFSFEAHVQLLAIFAIISPLVFLATGVIVRIVFHVSEKVPNWTRNLNYDVMREYLIEKREREYDNGYQDAEASAEFKLFIEITYYFYLLLSILTAFLLWNGVKAKCVTRLVMWIFCTGILTGIGITLVHPMKSIQLIEVGLAVVFVHVSIIYSFYSLIVVLCLVFKIKLIDD